MRQQFNYLRSIIKACRAAAGTRKWATRRESGQLASLCDSLSMAQIIQACMSLFELSLFMRLPLSQRSLIIVLRRAYWLCYVVVRECWFSVLHERLVFVLFCPFRCQCTHSGCVAYSGGQSNLTWSSFNWQIEWISLTTSIGSHGTLLYLT